MSSNVEVIQDDAALLAALGYKQELKRQFSFFSMAANAVITASAWVCGRLHTAMGPISCILICIPVIRRLR
jgi:hypothetical protein